jgi:hypothetical protein
LAITTGRSYLSTWLSKGLACSSHVCLWCII